MNAYLAASGQVIPRRHRGDAGKPPGRSNIVQQDPDLRAIYVEYRHLDDESRDARYELKVTGATDYDSFLLPKLDTIRRHIIPKITT